MLLPQSITSGVRRKALIYWNINQICHCIFDHCMQKYGIYNIKIIRLNMIIWVLLITHYITALVQWLVQSSAPKNCIFHRSSRFPPMSGKLKALKSSYNVCNGKAISICNGNTWKGKAVDEFDCSSTTSDALIPFFDSLINKKKSRWFLNFASWNPRLKRLWIVVYIRYRMNLWWNLLILSIRKFIE